MDNTKLPLPPYGKILQAYIDANIFPEDNNFSFEWNIFVGKDSYDYAKTNLSHRQISTCLPYQKDYKSYHWPIFGQRIDIINTGFISINYIRKMAIDLFVQYQPLSITAYESLHSHYDGMFPTKKILFLSRENI